MSRTKNYLQKKAVERIPAPAMNLVGKAVLQAVDAAVDQRWDRALRAAREAEGDTVDERVKHISKRFRRELSMMGAATGAVAAAPGLGTGAAVSALLADVGWFAMRATDLIMAVGAANGYTDSTADERRAWVLSVLAFGEDAADRFLGLLDEFESGTGAGAVVSADRVTGRLAGLAGGDVATLDALRRVNTSLATTVIARYGSRRSILAIGKLLPFGVGAVVGGSANYGLTRVVGAHANRFFDSYRTVRPVITGIPQPPSFPSQPPPPGAPAPNPDVVNGGPPPPPSPGSRRLPNPIAKLSKADRRRSIPTTGQPKQQPPPHHTPRNSGT
ncbi:MAG: EcsC family protein [Actinomycetota bacterium]